MLQTAPPQQERPEPGQQHPTRQSVCVSPADLSCSSLESLAMRPNSIQWCWELAYLCLMLCRTCAAGTVHALQVHTWLQRLQVWHYWH